MDTKTKRRAPPWESAYHRLTDEKRTIIETPRKECRSLSYIAERIGCSKSTVAKEIKRNKGKKGCRNKKAQGMARSRVAAKAAKRRTNENRNGVVRKVLPKGSAFDAILDEEMRRIDRMLNDRPLKCRNWRTPREAFTALLHRHLLAAA